MAKDLTPIEIVEQLDKYIVGQYRAKRAVAIALRNRYRRSMLPKELQEEIIPKNILMIGPTGVGKTEIARRLAKLVNAPFVKVEATKFTEVGYVGRDVESIIRDLVETSIRMVKAEKSQMVNEKAKKFAEERLLSLLCPKPQRRSSANPLEAIFGGSMEKQDEPETLQLEDFYQRKRDTEKKLKNKELENEIIEIEVDESNQPMLEVFSNTGVEEMGINLQDIFGSLIPKKQKKRKISVKDARPIIISQEAQKLIDMDEVTSQAINRAEQMGIVFIDEIDKIASSSNKSGPDVSREGVQRDILPIVEGSTIMTKYGPVKTDYVLFIGAGAFHISKPSDLIPELQGRFPIRVELEKLSQKDFIEILTSPKNALVKQYKYLLETEDIILEFRQDAIEEIAKIAYHVNSTNENIGARRLHTIMERLLEEVSFDCDKYKGEFVIDKAYVSNKLDELSKDKDIAGLIL